MTISSSFSRCGIVGSTLLAALCLMILVGCRPIAREQTLPPSVRSVYVPMILNKTSEPGLEERLTVELQKEILADGRLRLVGERQADAVVKITLMEFDRQATFLDRDDFPVGQAYAVRANLAIEENIPGRPEIGGIRRVYINQGFNADPRTTTYDPEPRTKEALARSMAKALLMEIMTGDYTAYDPTALEVDDGPRSLPLPGISVGGERR